MLRTLNGVAATSTYNVQNLVGWEIELDNRHAGLLEIGEESNLGRQKKQEGAALGVGASGRTADSVDVVF